MTRTPSPPVTPEIAGKIKYLLTLGWFQNRIAALFDVNPARVSEVKNGSRHPGVGPIPI